MTPEQKKIKTKLRMRLRREFNRLMISEIFKEFCISCENTFHHSCMDLHHKDESQKDFSPSKMMHMNPERVLKEAQKCVPLCSNCHRRHHHDHSFSCKKISGYKNPITESMINMYSRLFQLSRRDRRDRLQRQLDQILRE